MFYQCKWEKIILILLTGYIQREEGLDFLIKQCLWKLALTKDNKKSLIRLPCLKCVKDRFCSYISYLHFLWGCPARIVYNKAKRKTMRWKWTSHCVYLLSLSTLSCFPCLKQHKSRRQNSKFQGISRYIFDVSSCISPRTEVNHSPTTWQCWISHYYLFSLWLLLQTCLCVHGKDQNNVDNWIQKLLFHTRKY